MSICKRCRKDSNKEYMNLQICFICYRLVWNLCICESDHNLYDDPLTTKMYGIYHNANVEDLIQFI